MSNSEDASLDAAARAKGLVLAWSNGNGTRQAEYVLWKGNRRPDELVLVASYMSEGEVRRHVDEYAPEA